MNNKNSVVRGLLILMLLFSASILLRGMVAASHTFDVTVQPPDKSAYLLGETIRWSGSIESPDGDFSGVGVTLAIDGPQPVSQILSVIPGTYTYPENNLVVTVDSQNVTSSSSTLPGVTATRIDYDIEWTPPILLDPPPDFTLVPETAVAFPIPLVTPAPGPDGGLVPLPDTVEMFAVPLVDTPEAGQPSALPGADLAFAVPVVPTPTPEAGAADPLPAVTAAFAIPAVPTAAPDPDAPADLPTLTEAFVVPVVPTVTPEPGAPPDPPTVTEAFDVPTAATPTPETGAVTALDQSISEVFTIPTPPTPTAVAGAAELPSTTEMFTIPNSKSPRGMTTDGTSFYILVDGTPDQVYKVDSAGALVTAFDTDGIVDVSHNGASRNSAEGITYVGGYIYVSEDSWRDVTGGYSILKFDATTGAEADISAGDNSCAIPRFPT